MRPRYFFDTSALIRVTEGRPTFAPYREEAMVTERGHVYEYARYLLKEVGARKSREVLSTLRAEKVDPTNDDLVEASKLAARSSRISPQDALGYVLARRERSTFLTTDLAFRGMPGVEIVEA